MQDYEGMDGMRLLFGSEGTVVTDCDLTCCGVEGGKEKEVQGLLQKSGENKAMRKIKKEIKLGKQSTIKQFFGLSKK